MGKGSFIFYDVDFESLEFLSKWQVGELFLAISRYRLKGENPDFGKDSTLKVLFHQIIQHIELNEEKYKAISTKRSEAAKKRWNAKDANAYKSMQTDATLCLYDTDTDTVTDTVTDTDTVTVTDTVTDTDTDTDTDTVADTVACGAKKKTKENNYYNKKNNIPILLRDDPSYDIDAFTRKAIGLKYENRPQTKF